MIEKQSMPRNQSNFGSGGTRILHLVHGLEFGGIERWLLWILQQVQCDPIGMDVCYKGPKEGKLASQARAAGAIIWHCPLGPTIWPFVRRLKRILVLGRYSLLHVHTQAHSGPAVYAAKSVGIPVITTFHSTQQPPQTPFTRAPGIRGARQMYARFSMRYALRNSTVSTGVSKAVIDAVKHSAGLPQSRCEVLYLGCPRPLRLDVRSVAAYRRELGLPNDARIILHVGSLRPCKNHASILQVFRRVLASEPDVVLVLVGDGPLRPAIQDQIRQLRLAPHTRVLGVRNDATALMQLGDVFLFPSIREGLSVAMMEASAVGLPIVASDIPGNREATEKGASARLHDVHDIEGMAGSVVELLRDSSARQNLGAIARQVYERTFSMEASVRRLSTLYGRVLNRSGAEHFRGLGRFANCNFNE